VIAGKLVTEVRSGRARKLVAAILGGVSAAGVVVVGRLFGYEVEPELAGLVVLVLSSLAVYVSPPNELPT
jgi:energy-converting hydrogenase Eha subunit H